ncbi:MAG TPA: DNA primase [Caulobacter sp.]|nr:DNA primase [Caulobacter sp.]
MRFDDRFLEEIKSRVRLSDVIGKTVKLKRQGREYVGLSPFTKERSPSFFVNDDKGFFHDFSSGKHGDLIAFLQETERLSFVEAVERLAAEAGVPMPAPDPQAAEQEKKRQGLADWMDLAAAWFEGELRRPPGREARGYLDRRGLPETEWKRFGLGYAPPGRTALKDYLVAKGAKPGELVEAGLLIAPEDGGAPYDRFRDRIIFPIADARGRVVSFGGRALDPNARAKYLNGPETSLFHKGRMLYGLPEARKLLHSGGADAPLVVVEGYMDVIACQRAGIAAVAPMGTALTEDQMEVLWRLHPEPTLSFDGDAAGRRAANTAIDRALPLIKPGKSFRFAIVVGGKDPDDVLREQGPAALRAQLTDTTPFVEQLFHRERDLEPLDTPERRAGLKVRLRKLAATIADPDLSQAYREDLLGRYEQLWPTANPVFTVGAAAREMSRRRWDGKRGRLAGPIGPNAETTEQVRHMRSQPRPLSAALAYAALLDPHVLDDKVEQLSARGFLDERLSALADELVEFRFESDAVDAVSVRRRLEARGFGEDLFQQLARTARSAGAAFLQADLEPAKARRLWSIAFDLLTKLETLERAVDGAKQDLERDNDSSTLMRLKTERDLLKRLVDSGGWTNEAEAAVWLN